MDKAYILVAEPQSDLRWLYERGLKEAGHYVRTVADGPWMLSLAPPNPPDLIILDMAIDGIDALEVCRRLRACSDCAHVPIIMVGHRGPAFERIQAESAGANAYLLKPFSRTELLLCAERLLAEHALFERQASAS